MIDTVLAGGGGGGGGPAGLDVTVGGGGGALEGLTTDLVIGNEVIDV